MRTGTSLRLVSPRTSPEGWPTEPATEVERHSWDDALRSAIAGEDLQCHFQPIVDLGHGAVVGYEALARIEGPAGLVGPGAWLAAARVHSLSGELEGACLARAFAHRRALPPDCFLSVNVGPDTLTHRAVRHQLEAQGDLTGVVLELTDVGAVEADDEVRADLARHRRSGAMVAVDGEIERPGDHARLTRLRPSIVKLQRSLVAGVDRDPEKRAAVRDLRSAAGRIDAWLVAEGVERVEELDVLAELRVAMVQGYALARPAPPFEGIEPGLALRWSGARARSSR